MLNSFFGGLASQGQLAVFTDRDLPQIGARKGDKVDFAKLMSAGNAPRMSLSNFMKDPNFYLALDHDDVRTPEELANIAYGFKSVDYRTDELSPPVMVDNKKDTYRTFSDNNVFNPVDVTASRTGSFNMVDVESSTSTFECRAYGLATLLSKGVQRESTFDTRAAGMKRITDALNIDRAVRVWIDDISAGANWPSSNKETISTDWSNKSGSTPIDDLQRRLQASVRPVNRIWMGQQVGHEFFGSENVQSYLTLHVGQNGLASTQSAGAGSSGSGDGAQIDFTIPGFPPISIVQGKYRPASSLVEILPDDVVLQCTASTAELATREAIVTHQTFRVKGDSGNGWQARIVPLDWMGLEGSDMLIAGYEEWTGMISNVCGGLLESVT